MSTGKGECGKDYEDTKCDLSKLYSTKDEFVSGLYDYCDPNGVTCSKCCLLYLESTLKGDPCWHGMMRGTSQFVITDHWKDRNVTNMLLTCEHLHNLDEILLEPVTDVSARSMEELGSTASRNFAPVMVVFLSLAYWVAISFF